MWKWLGILGIVAGPALCGVDAAEACTVDGTPSLLVNGRLDMLNAAPTTDAQLRSWTLFLAPDRYQVGRPISLQEVRSKVSRALPPETFNRSWRWAFGDGGSTIGMRVTHIYHRAGTYTATVQVSLVVNHTSRWFQFDAVTIRVR